MTTPSKSEPTWTERAAGASEVLGLGLISTAGYFVALPLGLALSGAALFVLGYFGLSR